MNGTLCLGCVISLAREAALLMIDYSGIHENLD
jgi:hypothetical protein